MKKLLFLILMAALWMLPAYRIAAQTCITQAYTSQIGVRERTGRNDGREVEMYLHTCGLGPGYAWCAAFVKWCYMQCGIDTRHITAWAASCINQHHIVMKNGVPAYAGAEPQTGDNITFWDYAHQRVAHTGLYDRRINETFYESVEGNTNEGGSAEGDGVYRKRRSYRATYIISRWITTYGQ
ncbi:MAG: CHAP domain-containing protein [Bacteroidetes bacterium]|nr:CHAP domain-containing protein [Bacteroidota bacterium]